jgi:hypothetical protein
MNEVFAPIIPEETGIMQGVLANGQNCTASTTTQKGGQPVSSGDLSDDLPVCTKPQQAF